MGTRRIIRAARRYLLTGQPEPYAHGFMHSGGRWGVQQRNNHPQSKPLIVFFATPTARAAWVAVMPEHRRAVGRRHPLVKAFRRRNTGRVGGTCSNPCATPCSEECAGQ